MDHQDTVTAEANAVRAYPSAEIIGFPEEAIIRRRRRDQDLVVVTHNFETKVYDSPQALYAAFAAADPARNARMAEAGAIVAEANAKLASASAVLAAAMQRKRQAETLLNLVLVGFVVAGVMGLILLAVSL